MRRWHCILFCINILVCFQGQGQSYDIRLLREINTHRNTAFDGTFSCITKSALPVSAGLPLLLAGTSYLRHDSLQVKKACLLGTSLLVSTAVTTLLKYSIRRDRPFLTYPEIQKLAPAGSPSFPSGHTSSAFALATYVSIAYPRWYVVAPAFTWAAAVGYSRMHLGVHYPSDVLAGALIGMGSAYFSYRLEQWYVKKYLSKKKHTSL